MVYRVQSGAWRQIWGGGKVAARPGLVVCPSRHGPASQRASRTPPGFTHHGAPLSQGTGTVHDGLSTSAHSGSGYLASLSVHFRDHLEKKETEPQPQPLAAPPMPSTGAVHGAQNLLLRGAAAAQQQRQLEVQPRAGTASPKSAGAPSP